MDGRLVVAEEKGRGHWRIGGREDSMVDDEAKLLFVLTKDLSDEILKHLRPADLGRLEGALTREYVFKTNGVTNALMSKVRDRRRAEVVKLLPDGMTWQITRVESEGGGGEEQRRVTFSYDVRMIHATKLRLSISAGKKTVGAGANHSMVVQGSEVWTFGDGKCGKLGHGILKREMVPRRIVALSRTSICSVAAGHHFSLAISCEGSLFSWGCGQQGQLGHGSHGSAHDDEMVPRQVESVSGAADIAAGLEHSLMLNREGELYTWGGGRYGQTGQNLTRFGNRSNIDASTPTRVREQINVGNDYEATITLESMGKMVAVAAGSVHSLVRCVDGCVFACGGNESGQLGLADTHGRNMFTSLPAPVSDVVDISAGHAHSIAVTAHGAAFIWGGGRAMGGEKGLHRVIGGGVEHALVVQVSAGFYHSMLITSDGDVFSWGAGVHGQLGHGNRHNEVEPKRMPALGNNGGDTIVGVTGALRHSFVRTRRDVLAFGSSLNRTSSVSSGVVQSGCLGLGAMTIVSLTPAPIKLVSHKNGDSGGDDDEAT